MLGKLYVCHANYYQMKPLVNMQSLPDIEVCAFYSESITFAYYPPYV